MYNSKILNLIITNIINIISLVAIIMLFIKKEGFVDGYQNLYLLPLSYIIFYNLFLRKIMNNYGISLFLAVYLTVSFFRFVVLSLLVVEANWFLGRSNYSPSSDQFSVAILLMVYELALYNIGIWLFHNYFFKKVNLNKNDNNKVKFNNNNLIYLLFIFVTGLLVILKPEALNYFSFFSVNSEYTAIDELDGLTSIVTIFLNVSRLLIFFMIIKWIMQNIHPKNPIFSFTLVIFITIINSLIFFGTNRSDFIFNFAINLIILVYLYKKLGITVNIILISLLPIVVVGMTKYRNSVSITGGANKLVDITDYLQIYLGGVYNVALSLDLKVQNANIFNLLLDISRSAIGPNVILKNMDIVSSSELFNYRIFFSNHMSQIIPMIGQSNLYLGTIFSPILGLAFIFLAVFLTKEIVKVKRMELIYIFTLFSGRIGFVMAQNGNILLNDLTFFLPLFLLLYYLNNKVVIKNE